MGYEELLYNTVFFSCLLTLPSSTLSSLLLIILFLILLLLICSSFNYFLPLQIIIITVLVLFPHYYTFSLLAPQYSFFLLVHLPPTPPPPTHLCYLTNHPSSFLQPLVRLSIHCIRHVPHSTSSILALTSPSLPTTNSPLHPLHFCPLSILCQVFLLTLTLSISLDHHHFLLFIPLNLYTICSPLLASFR